MSNDQIKFLKKCCWKSHNQIVYANKLFEFIKIIRYCKYQNDFNDTSSLNNKCHSLT